MSEPDFVVVASIVGMDEGCIYISNRSLIYMYISTHYMEKLVLKSENFHRIALIFTT